MVVGVCKTTGFALRLPPEMKAAAEALKGVSLYRPCRAGADRGYVSGVHTDSINEALVSLMLEGMEPVLGYVQTALDEESKKHDQLHEIMKFFLETPTADRARAHNFPAGSKARA
jgi:hypothetical protein